MSRLMALPLVTFLMLALPASAKTMQDCEKIANPMEFNRCLASLGPQRGHTTRATAPQGNEGPRRKAKRDASSDKHADNGVRRRGGRQSMEFSVSARR